MDLTPWLLARFTKEDIHHWAFYQNPGISVEPNSYGSALLHSTKASTCKICNSELSQDLSVRPSDVIGVNRKHHNPGCKVNIFLHFYLNFPFHITSIFCFYSGDLADPTFSCKVCFKISKENQCTYKTGKKGCI